MPEDKGTRRAWALALVWTDREDFTEWQVRQVLQGTGIVSTQEPEAELFLDGIIKRREKGLRAKKRSDNCFCQHCGHAWVKRKRKRPDECPACKSRYWDRKPGVVVMAERRRG